MRRPTEPPTPVMSVSTEAAKLSRWLLYPANLDQESICVSESKLTNYGPSPLVNLMFHCLGLKSVLFLMRVLINS